MPNTSLKTANLFGLHIASVTFQEAMDLLCAQVSQRPAKVVVTPNVDHVISLSEDPALRALYDSADFAFADGMPIVWASRLLGQPLPERVTGADLFVALCQQAQMRRWRVAVLGGKPGQESALLARFALVYPGLQVIIRCPPMGFDYRSSEAHAAVEWVNATQPDVVFVCLGFPRQSLWSLHNRSTLSTGLVLCVGAAMEFALGLRRRPPRWMQVCGLEWLGRLLSEPKTLWRRYLVRDSRFFLLLWQAWREKK